MHAPFARQESVSKTDQLALHCVVSLQGFVVEVERVLQAAERTMASAKVGEGMQLHMPS